MGDGLDRAAATTNVIPTETAGSPFLDPISPPDWTRNAYIDHGTRCDSKDPAHAELWAHHVDTSCFLQPHVRAHLEATYGARVDAALSAYRVAIVNLRVEELIKKSPEKSSFLFELVLDVIGLVATAAVTRVID